MTTIELFSCSGGMALGFRRAGIEFTAAVDRSADARASYRANLGHELWDLDVLDAVGFRVLVARAAALGHLDLIVADPPCTPWSTAGKRLGLADERDCLLATVELIRILRPRCWLVANVPGLENAPNLPVVQRTIGSIPGYCVDYRKIDAADHGVPQHRRRPFWFGHPRATPCVTWPVPTHGDPAKNGTLLESLPPWRTCRDALGHLPPEQLGVPVHVRLDDIHHPPSDLDEPAMAVRAGSGGGANRALRMRFRGGTGSKQPREHVASDPAKTISTSAHHAIMLRENPKRQLLSADEPSTTVRGGGNGHSAPQLALAKRVIKARFRSDGSRREGREDRSSPTIRASRSGHETMMLNERHPIAQPSAPAPVVGARQRGAQGAGAMAWPWDRPATTVHADPRIGAPEHHGSAYMSAPNAVKLSELAATILQGFPEDHVFCGTSRAARDSQRGQAMPPPLAEAVAHSIMRWFATAQSSQPRGPADRVDPAAPTPRD